MKRLSQHQSGVHPSSGGGDNYRKRRRVWNGAPVSGVELGNSPKEINSHSPGLAGLCRPTLGRTHPRSPTLKGLHTGFARDYVCLASPAGVP
jgi:hypothetical protein